MIRVLQSFEIASRGFVVELQHNENGLPAGSILVSQKHKHQWKVGWRIIYNHMIKHSKIFEGETTSPVHLSFGSVEKMLESQRKNIEDEKQNIFHYWLEKSDQKPEEGELLEILIR